MPNKIPFIILLQLLLISCHYQSADKSEESARAKALQAIITKDDYTQTGWNHINALYHRKDSTADLASTLVYYNYAATYFISQLDYQKGMLYADSLLKIVNQPEYENAFFKERAEANISKAHSLYFLKQYKDCYYYYHCGLEEAAKIHDSALNVSLNQHMCMFLYEEGYYSKAIDYYKKLLVDVKGNHKTWERLMNNQGVYDNMGIAFLKDKQTDSAQVCFRAAINCLQQAYLLNPSQESLCKSALGTVYGNLGQAYAAQKQYDSAEYLYRQNIAVNSQPGFSIEDALITQQYLAEVYYQKKELPLLYTTLTQIKKGLDTINNKKISIQWTSLMNKYYVTVQKPEQALLYLEENLALRDSIKSAQPSTRYRTDIFDQMKILEERYDMNLLKKDNQMSRFYLAVTISLCVLIIIIAVLIFSFFRREKKIVVTLKLLNNQVNQKQALLQSTLIQLEKENHAKQHILHVVAHDLRNPIAAIQTLASMTEDEYEDEDAGRENLELIKSACLESNELISGILEMAENEEVKYIRQPVDVNALLSFNLPLLQVKAGEKKQSIKLTVPDQPVIILADEKKINRVVKNVVTNAVKFSPSGSIIEMAIHAEEDDVLLEVKDNGIGIPEKYRSYVFDAFTEAKRAGTDGEKTFGLGLSISKQIIEKHQGTIWFESEEGKGSVFYIRLPRFVEAVVADNASKPEVNSRS